MNSGLPRGGVFIHRHWRRALQLREKFTLNEEAFHLILAGGVGVIGGLVDPFFFYAAPLVHARDVGEVSARVPGLGSGLVAAAGGLGAGPGLHSGVPVRLSP